MPIRNSFSILMCNFKLVYKLLFFMLIIVLIGVAIFFSVLSPIFEDYFNEVREDFVIDIEEIIQHPILTLQGFLKMFVNYISINSRVINLKLLYLAILIIAVRFFLFLPIIPVSKIIYSKMTTNFDQGLFNAFVSSMPQSILFSFITSIIIGSVDIGLFIILVLFTVKMLKLIGLIALPICLGIAIFTYSLRMTLICQWLPEIARNDGKKIFSAFKNSLKPMAERFTKCLICIMVVNTITITLMLSTLLPTAGLVPIVLIPTCMVLYCILYMALNFSYNNQKYFTDNGVMVYDPTKKF